jgi:hypothetical protein
MRETTRGLALIVRAQDDTGVRSVGGRAKHVGAACRKG